MFLVLSLGKSSRVIPYAWWIAMGVGINNHRDYIESFLSISKDQNKAITTWMTCSWQAIQ
jgi:hypothetical protein